jgi:hypothetical protein
VSQTKLQGDDRVRQTDDGAEMQCSRCLEWWPADREFFNRDAGGLLGLYSWCRACVYENRAGERKRG